jgi:hypothetical protein
MIFLKEKNAVLSVCFSPCKGRKETTKSIRYYFLANNIMDVKIIAENKELKQDLITLTHEFTNSLKKVGIRLYAGRKHA